MLFKVGVFLTLWQSKNQNDINFKENSSSSVSLNSILKEDDCISTASMDSFQGRFENTLPREENKSTKDCFEEVPEASTLVKSILEGLDKLQSIMEPEVDRDQS